jgi:hypothetical protein
MSDEPAELAMLRAEVKRLRADRDGAREAARLAEAEAGRARGAFAEQYVQLERARQDQARFQESVTGRLWTAWNHGMDRFRARIHRGRR